MSLDSIKEQIKHYQQQQNNTPSTVLIDGISFLEQINHQSPTKYKTKKSTNHIKHSRFSEQNRLQRPWNKLPMQLKIVAIERYLEHQCPIKLTQSQLNHLKFVLISAIHDKKLQKASDVTYDSSKGEIVHINRLKIQLDGTISIEF